MHVRWACIRTTTFTGVISVSETIKPSFLLTGNMWASIRATENATLRRWQSGFRTTDLLGCLAFSRRMPSGWVGLYNCALEFVRCQATTMGFVQIILLNRTSTRNSCTYTSLHEAETS